MINGYLLRDVVNKVNEIHFTSRDEIHTLGHLYESMLREGGTLLEIPESSILRGRS
jgi:hypothetical protein